MNIDFFDEEDDIILPVTVWGEMYYIWCILFDMFKRRDFSKSNLRRLKVQFKIWKMSRGKL